MSTNILGVIGRRTVQRISPVCNIANYCTSKGPQLDALAVSLASKGYLRAQKPYTPPIDARAQIESLVAEMKISASGSLSMTDKFTILNGCFQKMGHGVPNSHLFEIATLDDVIQFYETSVNTTLPLDAMRTMDLPPNLHIQHEYVRFTGDKDDMFKGQTAFPKSSTLVTGLKYRKKYQGFVAKRSWP